MVEPADWHRPQVPHDRVEIGTQFAAIGAEVTSDAETHSVAFCTGQSLPESVGIGGGVCTGSADPVSSVQQLPHSSTQSAPCDGDQQKLSCQFGSRWTRQAVNTARNSRFTWQTSVDMYQQNVPAKRCLMSVSYLPLINVVILIALPLMFLRSGKKAFILTSSMSVSFVLLWLLWIYVPGWLLQAKANSGDAAAMYELARWTENHDCEIGVLIPWPFQSDVDGGYAVLEKSAAMDYPPALYALGVRLKHGIFVPRPTGWTGPEGNCFPQPQRGQSLIEKACRMGYQASANEEDFYWQQFRS